MRWLLPDHIQDTLPPETEQLEAIRRRLLDEFRLHGYQMVMPPLLEFLDSLTTGAGHDVSLRTFKLVDQLSGRLMGIRADMTTQVARIDAQLLNREGVSRLCYCASVLHTAPSTLSATREPLQLGAELYGHAGVEADVEIIRLLAGALRIAGIPASRIDVGHVGLFRALARRAGIAPAREETLFDLLQAKDVPSLIDFVAGVAEPARSALLALPGLYGDAAVLARAERMMPDDDEVLRALAEMRSLADALPDLPLSFDLADLRGYHYHSGFVFAAYRKGAAAAAALGGRYDEVGKAFGRGRPATGFSLDLRQLVLGLPEQPRVGAVLAPLVEDAALEEAIGALRDAGEVVVLALPGHDSTWKEAGCDRQLIRRAGRWTVEALQGE